MDNEVFLAGLKEILGDKLKVIIAKTKDDSFKFKTNEVVISEESIKAYGGISRGDIIHEVGRSTGKAIRDFDGIKKKKELTIFIENNWPRVCVWFK